MPAIVPKFTTVLFSNLENAIDKGREAACLVEEFEYLQKESFPETPREEGGYPIFILETRMIEAGYHEEPNQLNPDCFEWEEWGNEVHVEVYQETEAGIRLVWALRKLGFLNSGFYFKEA